MLSRLAFNNEQDTETMLEAKVLYSTEISDSLKTQIIIVNKIQTHGIAQI